jgi:hypothetical protein
MVNPTQFMELRRQITDVGLRAKKTLQIVDTRFEALIMHDPVAN